MYDKSTSTFNIKPENSIYFYLVILNLKLNNAYFKANKYGIQQQKETQKLHFKLFFKLYDRSIIAKSTNIAIYFNPFKTFFS